MTPDEFSTKLKNIANQLESGNISRQTIQRELTKLINGLGSLNLNIQDEYQAAKDELDLEWENLPDSGASYGPSAYDITSSMREEGKYSPETIKKLEEYIKSVYGF